MDDGYIPGRDPVPTLPDDYRPVVRYVWETIRDVTPQGTQRFLTAARELGRVKGDPEKLDGGVRILSVDVAGQIGQARGAIERGTASFGAGWAGGGADSFQAYLPVLTAAIASVESSAIATADAVAAFRQSLHELWSDVVARTVDLGVQVLNAISRAPGADDAARRRAAVGAVLGLVEGFVSYAAGIVDALLSLDRQSFLAFDKLRAAERIPDTLVDLGTAATGTGPTGVQLPMPAVAPAGGGGVAVDPGMMRELGTVFRANGTYWDRALNHQIRASLNHFTPDAFGLAGRDFHATLHRVLTRDHVLYLHSDERLDALGGLLDTVGEAYDAEDRQSARELSEYLRDEPRP